LAKSKLLDSSAQTPRTTLRDIARQVGVDVSTVSLALRGSPKVTAPTAERIREAATRLGYRPDPVLAALNAYRDGRRRDFRQVVAWLTNFPREMGSWRDRTTYAEYFDGAARRAEQCGYHLEEFPLYGGEVSPARMVQILETRGVHGLLLCPQPSPRQWPEFDFSQFSAVTFGYSLLAPTLHLVSNHQFLSVRTAAERLHQGGYRRIALALPPFYHESLRWQSDGAFLAFARRRASPQLRFIYEDSDWTAANFNRWLNRTRPDAVIVDPYAMAGWWEQLDRRVPEDLAVAAFGLSQTEKAWSGIYQNNHAIGVAGFDLLMMMLHRNERGVPEYPMRLLIEGVWRDGPTTPRLAVAPAPPGPATAAPQAGPVDCRVTN
jgi:DNA-binding LacI/PurR family transcriptional regulator